MRDPAAAEFDRIVRLLTVDAIPTRVELDTRALILAKTAHRLGAKRAMIDGAPYLMPSLVQVLAALRIDPLFAFCLREAVEERLPGGVVRKVTAFRHHGFVRPPPLRPERM